MRSPNVWISFALVLTVACGGGYSSAPPGQQPTGNTPPPAGAISVTNNAFIPAAKTVTAGATVQWAWNSCSGGDIYGARETCVVHDVVFDDGSGSSGQKSQGTYSRTFAAAGTFPYHCAVHGAAVMSGSISVTP